MSERRHRELDPTREAAERLDPARGVSLLVIDEASVSGHPVPEDGALTIGRSPECDVVIAHDSVSRVHARVLGGEPALIEDMGSRNGTHVAGERIAPSTPRAIGAGTILRIGDVTVVVQPGQMRTSPLARGSVSEGAGLIVRDPVMRDLLGLIDVVAPSGISVMLLGETGVGKEVFAEAIHARSTRASRSLLRLNCAALAETLLESELFGHERGAFTGASAAKAGLFEAADGGTLFLDEVGEMPLSLQVKLLRTLESGEVMRVGSTRPLRVDVRVVAATHRDLTREMAEGRFRPDLFFRLNGISVAIPPLRARVADVEPLAEMFAARSARQSGGRSLLSAPARKKLLAHGWPGNVRELRNVIERGVVLARGGEVGADHIVFDVAVVAGETAVAPSSLDLHDEVLEVERRRIVAALAQCHGNKAGAARMLGIARNTLLKRLKQFGLDGGQHSGEG